MRYSKSSDTTHSDTLMGSNDELTKQSHNVHDNMQMFSRLGVKLMMLPLA